jgi:thioredoxin reductase (NADPH)
MEQVIENIAVYGGTLIVCFAVILLYLRRQKRNSRIVEEKISKAKQEGLYEPVTLYPRIDPHKCIQTGACISACPEKDIIGIVNGKATTINASHCVGHGACFHACPTHAITLMIGTETRGVELPHVSQTFETNIGRLFIAGELGGMGLIKNAVEQGRQAVENIAKANKQAHHATYDLIIVGAGPAGIAASLTAKKLNLKALTLEQDSLGGTIFSFPRSKVVMTAPMELPLYGQLKLFETSKADLLDLWMKIIQKNGIEIKENIKVESVIPGQDHFTIETNKGEKYTSRFVLLAIGRRGSPRKLGIPGEELEKVAYRLLEPEAIEGKEIVVVGGGDSAIEAALSLFEKNNVTLCYRGDKFSRIKPGNKDRIAEASGKGLVQVRFSTNLIKVMEQEVVISSDQDAGATITVTNDLIYIFAGGELPGQFLRKIGITITEKFGDPVLKHR